MYESDHRVSLKHWTSPTQQRRTGLDSSDVSSTTSSIAIVGTGYVGLTTGACLASLGYQVTCCDIDATKVATLRQGVIPIVEEGLADIVADGLTSGRLSFEHGVDPAVRDSDIVFLCVPTPQDEDGSADLQYVRAAADELGPLLKSGAIVVNKSTVPVGSFHVVGTHLQRDDVSVVSNPEFLREGTAVYDFLQPDRVVIGAINPEAAERIADLYSSLDAPIITTDPASAELIKYSSNGFLAMKISFINSVAAVCEQVGADITDVVAGLGSDHRVGSAFLRPGPGWGGSCFPKDARALVSTSAQYGFDFSLMRGVIETNEHQYQRMIDKTVRAAGRRWGERLDGVTVGVWGLTFKANTDDLRESPSLRIVEGLRRLGVHVQAYDPTTTGPLTSVQQAALGDLTLASSALDAVRDADALVVLTEWDEFATIDLTTVRSAMRGHGILDARNVLDRDLAIELGFDYQGVGR